MSVVCLLDAFGKTFNKLSLDSVKDAPLGFNKKRDRSWPMVGISAVMWWMRQMKCGFVLRLHRLTKVFYRLKHDRGRMATTECSWRDCIVPDDAAPKRASDRKTREGRVEGRLKQGWAQNSPWSLRRDTELGCEDT